MSAEPNLQTVLYRCGCLYRQWQEEGPAEVKRLNHRCEKHYKPPRWLTEDSGLPRDRRGNVVWDKTADVLQRRAERERELPAWVQQELFQLRQEVWTCQRAIIHRNQRLRDLKHQLRAYQRMFLKSIGVVPKSEHARATGALSQFVGATVLAIRLAGDAIAMHLKMPAGDWHGDRDLTFYNIDESGAPPFVRIDGQYVPKEEL